MRKLDFNPQKITKYSSVASFIFLVAFIQIPYLGNLINTNENTIVFEEEKIGTAKNLVNYPVQDSYPKLATLENDEMEIFSTADQFEGYTLFILTRLNNVGGYYDLICYLPVERSRNFNITLIAGNYQHFDSQA